MREFKVWVYLIWSEIYFLITAVRTWYSLYLASNGGAAKSSAAVTASAECSVRMDNKLENISIGSVTCERLQEQLCC